MSWSSWTGGRGLRGSVISLVRATTDRVLQDINQDIADERLQSASHHHRARQASASPTPTTNLPRDGPASPTTEKRDGLLGLPENFLHGVAADGLTAPVHDPCSGRPDETPTKSCSKEKSMQRMRSSCISTSSARPSTAWRSCTCPSTALTRPLFARR